MDIESFGLESDDYKPSLVFEVLKTVLLPLLEKTSSVVPAKDIIPVLANFKIQATETSIRSVTTNLAITMLCASNAVEVGVPGVAYFPVKRFLEIVRECDDKIKILVVGRAAMIKSGRTTWTLNLHSGIGFPELPSDTNPCEIKEIDKDSFVEAIKKCRYAAAVTTTKAAMMMLSIEKEKMTACDGTRLHQLTLKDFPFNVSIPIEAVDDILKLLDKSSTETVVKFGNAPNHLVVWAGSNMLVIAKMAEEFPDVNALMLGPALRNQDLLKVETQDLIDAVRKIRVLADIEHPAVTLSIKGTSVLISTLDRYGDKAETSVDTIDFAKEKVLTFNHRMLTQALQSYGNKICYLYSAEVPKSKRPAVILRDPESGTNIVLAQMISVLA